MTVLSSADSSGSRVSDRDRPDAGAREERAIVRRHLGLTAGLTAVVAFAPRLLFHPNAPRRLHVVADSILGGWLRWDGWWYVTIAAHGYTYRAHHMSSVAFFPVYPLAIRALGALLPGGVALAAVAITVACGATAFVLFHRWCRRRMTPTASRVAVGALAVYPFAWFLYGAAYSDALFLALVLAAFLLVESDRPVLAGLVGLVATATRPTGVTLVIGLVAVVIDRRRRSPAPPGGVWASRDVGVLLSIGGLVLWCMWLAVRFGNPVAFIETEGAPGWNQPPGVHTWLKFGFFRALSRVPPAEAAAIVFQVFVFVAFLCVLPAVRRRFGAGYAIYSLAAAVVPAISSGDFLGVGRYLLPVFPVFAVVGSVLAQRPVKRRRAIAAASGTLLVVGTALFSAGYLVS